jgi:hypothetical protein
MVLMSFAWLSLVLLGTVVPLPDFLGPTASHPAHCLPSRSCWPLSPSLLGNECAEDDCPALDELDDDDPDDALSSRRRGVRAGGLPSTANELSFARRDHPPRPAGTSRAVLPPLFYLFCALLL